MNGNLYFSIDIRLNLPYCSGIFGKIMRKLRRASEKVYARNQVLLRRTTQVEACITQNYADVTQVEIFIPQNYAKLLDLGGRSST